MCGGGRGKRARESWPHSHSRLVLGLCVILVLCCCPVGMDDSVSVAHMTMGPSLSARECRQQATLLTLLMCRWNTTHAPLQSAYTHSPHPSLHPTPQHSSHPISLPSSPSFCHAHLSVGSNGEQCSGPLAGECSCGQCHCSSNVGGVSLGCVYMYVCM